MAPVDGPSGAQERGQRGQLILVTGLTIAALLVVLVLLLNTAIYTENLATRGVDDGAEDAIEYRTEVVDGVGGAVDRENRAEVNDHGTIEDNVENATEQIDATLSRQRLEYGSRTNVAIDDSVATDGFTRGFLIVDDADDQFSHPTSDDNTAWTVANNLDGTRAFRMTVDSGSLNAVSTADADDAFHVNVTDSSDSWKVYVYEDSVTGDVAVATNGTATAGTDPTERCTVAPDADGDVTIDFTAGTVAGDDGEKTCRGLRWAEGLDPSDDQEITFVNGQEAVGTYELTIDGTLGTHVTVSTITSDSPRAVEAIYDVTVEITYSSEQVDYQSDVRVAPGEPDA